METKPKEAEIYISPSVIGERGGKKKSAKTESVLRRRLTNKLYQPICCCQ